MTYLVLVRHGESIWHALWTKEPVLLWTISADGCCGPRPAGTAGQSVVGIMAVVIRRRWVGFPLGWGRPVLSSQRSP